LAKTAPQAKRRAKILPVALVSFLFFTFPLGSAARGGFARVLPGAVLGAGLVSRRILGLLTGGLVSKLPFVFVNSH